MSDYSLLKVVAEAAEAERLENDHRWPEVGECDWFDTSSGPEYEYLCNASPATILNLLAENERLRAGLKGDYDLDAWLDWAEEAEELRKDADKWKIVERAMTQLQSDEQGAAIWSACSRILISVAGKMNSARSTVTEEGVTFDGIEAGDWRVTVERINADPAQGEQP